MKNELKIADKLKKKYHKCEEITNFKDMINRSEEIFKTRVAFKLKDKNGNIYNKTYEELKKDVVSLGTSLIEKGLFNKRIAVIGKNSYKWAISYLSASIIGVVVPIDKELQADDVINFLNVSESSCILGDSKNLEQIVKTENINKLKNKEIIFINFDKEENTKKNNDKFLSFNLVLEKGKKLLEKGNTKFEEIKINPDELRILLPLEQQEMRKVYVYPKEIFVQIYYQHMEL